MSECVCVYAYFIYENPIFTLFEGELTKYNKINIVNTFFKIGRYAMHIVYMGEMYRG